MDQHVRIREIFQPDEIQSLTQRSDWSGAWAVGSTWAVIILTFGTLAYSWDYLPLWGRVFICALALIILAGRQLALAILMHDAAHFSLFKSKWLNMHLTDWLCARPIWNDLKKYRPYHLKHHARTSQADDPDLGLVKNFPIDRAALRRKFFRDLTGQSGIKFLTGRVLMDMQLLQWSVSNDPQPIPRAGRTDWELFKNFAKNSAGMWLTNATLFAALAACGQAKLYLLWPLAYITPFPLFIRIRAMAEHAGCPQSHSALIHTRTTRAGFLARCLVAPIHVNYHMEHHLMASVPQQHLKRMHQLLHARLDLPKPPSYWQVIKTLSDQKSPANES